MTVLQRGLSRVSRKAASAVRASFQGKHHSTDHTKQLHQTLKCSKQRSTDLRPCSLDRLRLPADPDECTPQRQHTRARARATPQTCSTRTTHTRAALRPILGSKTRDHFISESSLHVCVFAREEQVLSLSARKGVQTHGTSSHGCHAGVCRHLHQSTHAPGRPSSHRPLFPVSRYPGKKKVFFSRPEIHLISLEIRAFRGPESLNSLNFRGARTDARSVPHIHGVLGRGAGCGYMFAFPIHILKNRPICRWKPPQTAANGRANRPKKRVFLGW